MIVAYCNRCGEKIEPTVSAGCRIVLGNHEWSWHLCHEHQVAMERLVLGYLEAHEARKVRP